MSLRNKLREIAEMASEAADDLQEDEVPDSAHHESGIWEGKYTPGWRNNQGLEQPKPCPFCAYRHPVVRVNLSQLRGQGRYDVHCNICCATSNYTKTREGALRAWNTRPEWYPL